MLICRECGGEAIVDKGKHPMISARDIWYHVKCQSCNQQLGLLANVESTELYDHNLAQTQRRLMNEVRNRTH